jgi:hypothetical protein
LNLAVSGYDGMAPIYDAWAAEMSEFVAREPGR